MSQDPYKYFRPEARDLLDQIGKGVLELEKGGGNADVVQRLLRLAHTLKGAARVVKQGEVADQAHAIEEALAPFRESGADVPSDRIDAMLSLVDGIGRRISALGPPVAPGKPSHDEGFQTIRAGVAEMDALLEGVTETHAQLSAFRTAGRLVDRARDLSDLLVRQFALRGLRESVPPTVAPPGGARSTAEQLRHILAALERRFNTGVDQMDRELRQMREATEQLRLAPAGAMFTSLERTARDAAQVLGKRVIFEGTGGDVRLETHVLGAVQKALMQAVRNAVAHGIESESDRKAAGKALSGRVAINVARHGRRVIFRCEDDGRGVDLEAVRRVATRKGLSASETKRLDAQDLMRLLLRGGITTSSTVTEVSGRGIGLDVMREVAEQLGGEVIVLTKRAEGTTFELVIPVSLASLEVLICEIGGVEATIPLDAVRRTVRVAVGEISRTAQGDSVVCDGKAIPFIPLTRALRMRTAGPHAGRVFSAVIVEAKDGVAAVGVDRFLGTARIVLRPLPDLTSADRVVAGASLDAEGNPQLVLDPDGLVAKAMCEDPGDVAPEPVHRPLLVIDDSLTTRMLERSILESAGYEVDTVTSGEEALERARGKAYALFLVDVEMPGMDGFTFIEHTRLDPGLRDVPAILVTARTSAEDRQRGKQVGAQGYIVKSEFNQAELLTRIKQLLT
jgi:two-component system chemotaxis sensor kinase CheA